ncbi:MAG: YegS/Rv2252/BmrU family lipid kinase [Lachnospiraceae bacterium]|nr:YegS/Rv2252/BmrU family lipid kinase [Lachnospiraceae bacterium]
MKNALFIFNPSSGKARIKNQLFDIVQFYTQNGYQVTVYPTQKPRDGYWFTKELRTEYDLIVCSGGDGTLNEIISGCLDSGKITQLGYIPSGSTNDFARSIGIPSELEEALDVTCKGTAYGIDIGHFNNQYFIYVAGFGAFTRISYSTPQKAKNSLGYLAYVLEGIKELTELRSYHVIMEHDFGVVEGDFIMGFVMNSFSIAGFRSPVSSFTELNDGLFEILLIKSPGNILELQEIITSLLSGSLESKHIVCVRTSSIKIRSDLMDWTLDGEFGGRYENVEIFNIRQAIRILST